ncbi:hypothetical protein [Kribbella pratensis]|uniref:Uncharacterized protein n=1 Tax=Kribbella pratensis TaxID=2512112 RepID=A0A4R8CKC5_9ACTN|nr:hypothetical protein [Kribbella pratensis]TDW75153.1 hypothetical protein EV653_0274 [Kribbella pratensis]
MDLLFGWRGRVRRWPRIDGRRLPWGELDDVGDIKVISTEVLKGLMEKAARTPGVSATGRPEWLEEHRDALGDHYVVVFGPDSHDFYRCIVFSVLEDRPAGAYTLDMSRADFHALPDISPAELVEFAHRHLSAVPMVPLDPSQEQSWQRVSDER